MDNVIARTHTHTCTQLVCKRTNLIFSRCRRTQHTRVIATYTPHIINLISASDIAFYNYSEGPLRAVLNNICARIYYYIALYMRSLYLSELVDIIHTNTCHRNLRPSPFHQLSEFGEHAQLRRATHHDDECARMCVRVACGPSCDSGVCMHAELR